MDKKIKKSIRLLASKEDLAKCLYDIKRFCRIYQNQILEFKQFKS